MAAEGTGGGELAQLVSDHILGDIHGNVTAAVVDGDGVSDEGRENRGGTGPGLDDLLVAALVHLIDSLQQLGGGEGKSPVGRPGPVTPWGKPALGYKTRKTKNKTDKYIVKRRNAK